MNYRCKTKQLNMNLRACAFHTYLQQLRKSCIRRGKISRQIGTWGCRGGAACGCVNCRKNTREGDRRARLDASIRRRAHARCQLADERRALHILRQPLPCGVGWGQLVTCVVEKRILT
jgi:hypothetical protein